MDEAKIGIGLAVAGGIGVLAAGGVAGLRASVRRSVYLRPRPATPVDPPPGFELLHSLGGTAILFAPAPSGAPTIVHLHGNAQELGSMGSRLSTWHDAGFGVAAIEYPGYGPEADGRPDERRIAVGCEDAMRFLAARDDVGEIVLVGYSLGSAFAVDLAHRGYGDKLVVGAGFTSAADVCRTLVPHVPPSILLGRERLDNLAKAPEIGIPAVVIHGTADEQMPCEMGRRLAGALPRGRFVPREGIDHQGLGDHLLDAVRIACEHDEGDECDSPPTRVG